MADLLEIDVIEFKSTSSDEYILTFNAIDSRVNGKTNMEKKLRKYIIHLRHNPSALSLAIQSKQDNPYTKEKYLKAVELLKTQLQKSKKIYIMRLAAKGYRHIKGKDGHYQSETLKNLSINGRDFVCLVHSDL